MKLYSCSLNYLSNYAKLNPVVALVVQLLREIMKALLIALLTGLGLSSGRVHAATIVLFTADTDSTTAENPLGVPADDNPNLPTISPGVNLTPNSTPLDGVATGPLNGITYGPGAYLGSTGGTTGFVASSYTFSEGGTYQLVWEVSDVRDLGVESAFAFDNVTLNGSSLYGFELGIPTDFTVRGTAATSEAVVNLAPTEGNSFAFIDTIGNSPAIYNPTGTGGSRLISSAFNVVAGDVLAMDLAFLTNDGSSYPDYAIATVTNEAIPDPEPIPEPSTVLGSILLLGCGALMKSQSLRKRQKI